MRFQNVVIQHLGYALGPKTLTSEEIEDRLLPMYERLKLPAGRLELMTGIKARQFWKRNTKASEASTFAAMNLLTNSNFPKKNIDLLIHAAVSRDRLEPATAAYVHEKLELSGHTQILDISNACLGFLNAVILSAGLIECGQVENVLIVAGENGQPLVEHTIDLLLNPIHTRKSIKPYFANLTIGAGAVAAILTNKQNASGNAFELDTATLQTDTSHNHLCEGDNSSSDAASLEMQTDSEELLHAGIRLAKENWELFKKQSGWTEETPQHTITHQVGRAHQKLLYETLGLDDAKDFSTFPELGNVGSVSLPITLALAMERGLIQQNNQTALLGIGSGLSSIMLGVNYREFA
jgi:3-oxoacyl-[acyl-carrier-protein] synthase III